VESLGSYIRTIVVLLQALWRWGNTEYKRAAEEIYLL